MQLYPRFTEHSIKFHEKIFSVYTNGLYLCMIMTCKNSDSYFKFAKSATVIMQKKIEIKKMSLFLKSIKVFQKK